MNPWRFPAPFESIRAAAVSAIALSAAGPAAQTAVAPAHDETLVATDVNIQECASFGFSMAMGSLGPPSPGDDIVVCCALNESDPWGFDNCDPGSAGNHRGAAYPFFGTRLVPHYPHPRLLGTDPGSTPSGEPQLGRLDVVFGNVRGEDYDDERLLFISSPGLDRSESGCTPVPNQGAVEVFDLASTGSPLVLTLRPPPDTGSCPPTNVTWFGHAVAVGDVDGDEYDDLIVGAMHADPPASGGGGEGRVYVFFGHANFLSSPYQSWIALKAPIHAPGYKCSAPTCLTTQCSSTPNCLYDDGDGSCDPAPLTGVNFGTAAIAPDIDGDGLAELVVGQVENLFWRITTPPSATGGKVLIYRGTTLLQMRAISETSPFPHLFQQAADQMVANPNTTKCSIDRFGWRLFSLGDVGGPSGALDAIPDIGVFCEQGAEGGGALFLYWGTGSSSGNIVNTTFRKLVTPSGAFGSAVGNRFGRAAATVVWPVVGGGDDTFLLVGEGNAEADDPSGGPDVVGAGRVWCFATPIPISSEPTNAWSAGPLLEPGGPKENSVFGSWIVTGNYKGNTDGIQQFVVSARDAIVGSRAGRAYSFVDE